MNLSRAGVLVLVAFSIPLAIEFRVLLGFFGFELPLAAVAVFEAIFLVAIAIAYSMGERPKQASKH